jgi:hypothetical protein
LQKSGKSRNKKWNKRERKIIGEETKNGMKEKDKEPK